MNVLWQHLGYPVGVFLLHFGHDDDLIASLAVEGRNVLHGSMLEAVLPRVLEVSGHTVLVPKIFENVLEEKQEDCDENGDGEGETQNQSHGCFELVACRHLG